MQRLVEEIRGSRKGSNPLETLLSDHGKLLGEEEKGLRGHALAKKPRRRK
jgi:hypothetical protein